MKACMQAVKLTAAAFVSLTAAVSACASIRDSLPPVAVKQLSAYLPAAVVPMPKSGAAKIYPLYSEDRMLPDRRRHTDAAARPLAIVSVMEDGKGVRLAVPQTSAGGETTNMLFNAEDVFGKVSWKVERYESPCLVLAYFPGPAKQGNLLMGAVERGTPCASLGTMPGPHGAGMRLLMIRKSCNASGVQCDYCIVLAREAPPVETQAEYDTRAKELLSERAYAQNAPWGKMHPAILTDEGAYECAGMCSDFVKYMYDDSFATGGERFTDPEEIRTGDIIRFKSHFFSVVYRKGGVLQTIEGNMNAHINKSSKMYRLSGGKLFEGDRELEFEYGKHYWPASGAAVGK